MANELNLAIVLAFSKGGASLNINESCQLDVTGDAYVRGVQEIGTSEEYFFPLLDISTRGYMYIKNLDDTNFIEVGLTASYAIKVPPGGICLFQANGAIYAKADTANCLTEYAIVEV